MIEVTAAIAVDGPKRARQVCAARSIGSNGKLRGLGTDTSLRYRDDRA
jgi:hypothetical protein